MALDLKNLNLKDLDIRSVYEWPIYGRLVIFGVVCGGVLFLGYFFDFSDLSDQIVTRYKQELDLKQQVEASLKSEEEMKEIVNQFPQVMKIVNEWQDQLINGTSLPDLLNQILKMGAANSLKFTLFAPGAKKQQDDYFMVPIKVVVQGSYTEIATFISQLANLPQIVSVSDFILSKESNSIGQAAKPEEPGAVSGPITSAMTLEVYYLANKK